MAREIGGERAEALCAKLAAQRGETLGIGEEPMQEQRVALGVALSLPFAEEDIPMRGFDVVGGARRPRCSAEIGAGDAAIAAGAADGCKIGS